jgi:rsbT co-antagonist protein RsbR
MTNSGSSISAIIHNHQRALLEEWLKQQTAYAGLRTNIIKENERREQSGKFLTLLASAIGKSGILDINSPDWEEAKEFLAEVSNGRARQGYTPTETAMFIFSLKEPLVMLLRQDITDHSQLNEVMWNANVLLDKLGLWTTEIYQSSRNEIILRQQQELLELSTPVVKLWEGVLALPLIGTLDSARTQIVMESLLQKITETGSSIAIIDITGVPTVDTLVAQHLLKTVAAARLMGADCIISGIRPQIAQTIVHLGVELTDVTTKANLSDAFQLALKRTGMTITRVANRA